MTLKGILLTGLGFVLLAIGAIGVFLPVWPTTPFVLLAMASFSGNPAMQRRMLSVKFINEHAVNYRRRTGLTRGNVILSLSLLWVSMCISALVAGRLWVTVLLAAVGLMVTVHILCIARPKNR